MSLNWQLVVQGAVTGLVASVILGAMTLLRLRIRNWLLRRAIIKQVNRVSLGDGVDGIGIHIRNHTGRPFTVRGVSLATDKGHFLFNPTGEVQTSEREKKPRLTKEQKERLKRGEAISLGGVFRSGAWRVEPKGNGFVEVEPFTDYGFRLPPHFVEAIGKPLGIKVTVEYEAWTKERKIISIMVNRKSISHLDTLIERFRNDVKSGKLDKVRATFGLPPVAPLARAFAPQPNVEVNKPDGKPPFEKGPKNGDHRAKADAENPQER